MFRDATTKKGEDLYESGHVFDVNERLSAASSVLRARCVRQASVCQEAYSITIKLDNTRRITEAHCTCRGGTCGQCKHTTAVVAYVNREDTSTKTSITNVWKRPSAKQLGMYNKGVLFSEMFASKLPDGRLQGQPVPASIVNSNCPLGIMLRQEEQVKENLKSLNKLLPRVGQPRVIFGADDILSEELCDDILLAVMVSEDECKEIAQETILQSACPQWHRLRAPRISASSKAHRVKIRTADFDTLAEDLASPRSFKSASCSYGVAKEPEARKEYESSEKKKVIQVGLVVCVPQPWLCCSPDGLVEENGEVRLLEIKCPSRCETKPVVNENINVDYLQYEGKKLKLQESHVYYTQVQVSMYVVGANACDLYVYSPKGSECVKVMKDMPFLKKVVPKLEWFFFRHYFPAVLKRQSL
ncbi:uncharacterized protein ISCGN_022702 [Ixodes scapularis]